ncbi:hypothetical protein BU26DRAFT_348726 [Trematosphaeria pertusa]|uniref:Uncharacterized protein n=1 Tax=Trematosphaeria pertusa TaxID=390896 RepID=A0A6A6IA85_9PLEO|nr:uncharacterized protein BU26DRAFT_348726 [Trematosphaeria pertusa]KAF2247494.1 hypothetical protein BU26DRAFT_348726 [Trematosphaeria pertusa]
MSLVSGTLRVRSSPTWCANIMTRFDCRKNSDGDSDDGNEDNVETERRAERMSDDRPFGCKQRNLRELSECCQRLQFPRGVAVCLLLTTMFATAPEPADRRKHLRLRKSPPYLEEARCVGRM